MLRRCRRFDAVPEGPIKSASRILPGLSGRGNPNTTTELGAFHSSPIETAYAGSHLHAQSLSLGRRNTNR